MCGRKRVWCDVLKRYALIEKRNDIATKFVVTIPHLLKKCAEQKFTSKKIMEIRRLWYFLLIAHGFWKTVNKYYEDQFFCAILCSFRCGSFVIFLLQFFFVLEFDNLFYEKFGVFLTKIVHMQLKLQLKATKSIFFRGFSNSLLKYGHRW